MLQHSLADVVADEKVAIGPLANGKTSVGAWNGIEEYRITLGCGEFEK